MSYSQFQINGLMRVPQNNFLSEKLGGKPGSDCVDRMHVHEKTVGLFGKQKTQSEKRKTLPEFSVALLLPERVNFDIISKTGNISFFLANDIKRIQILGKAIQPTKNKSCQRVFPVYFPGDKNQSHDPLLSSPSRGGGWVGVLAISFQNSTVLLNPFWGSYCATR